MPNSTQGSGDGERSANDAFMDQWADPDDQNDYDPNDYYGDPESRRGTPGLLPGALIGAGIASLCAVGIYLLAGGGDHHTSTGRQTVTYTQEGTTETVTQPVASDPANDSTFTSTSTVTLPQQTVTVQAPGKDRTVTQTTTATKTETTTETSTATTSAPPVTTTITLTPPIGPPKPPGPVITPGG